MNNRKKAFVTIPVIAATTVLAGCGTAEVEGAAEYPSRPIEVIVPFSAGGGTDLGARQLLPIVEEELGADIQVVNRPGAGGWVGWQEAVSADPDGYTLSYLNTPNLISGYMNPAMDRDNSVDDFSFIANQVTDAGVISIRSDEGRFTDLPSLIEYAQENTVTTTSTGVASDDHIAVLRLNDALGTKFETVHTEGTADGKASFLGGHIDVLFNNVGEAYQPHEQGELKAVGVLSEERSEFLSDVPTLEEAGFGSIQNSSSRGIGAPAGLPEEIHQELADAFQKAIESQEHQDLMAEQGLAIDYLGPEDYESAVRSQEKQFEELRSLLGWED